MASQIRAVGISWFREEDYVRAHSIMDDPQVLPVTYREWQKKAEGTERQIKAQGFIVYRAIIDPDTFPAWCALRGLNVDAKARMAFGSEFAFEQVKNTH